MFEQKLTYIISRFPTLTETFIIREIEEVKRKGVEVEIFSLQNRKSNEAIHEGIEELIRHTYYLPYLLSPFILKPLIFYFTSKTSNTIRALWKIIRTHIDNPVLLLKTMVMFPKALAIAYRLRGQNTKIHAHWATIPTTVAWIISELNGCEYTFTAHAWDIFKTDTMLEEKIIKAKKVITCTGFNKKYLLEKYLHINPEKIVVVYHGLDLKRFAPKKRTPDKHFTILSIGRLTEKKGIHYLLRVCSMLREKGLPFRAHIIYVRGDFEKEIFRLYDSLGLESCVELIPEMSQEKLIHYFENADCFVLPCLVAKTGERDGIPNVILEALAMELPVVSTNISGIPEVIRDGETGLLVSPENTAELANAIERLYSNENLREELGKAGRDFVNKEFEISSSVDRLLNEILS